MLIATVVFLGGGKWCYFSCFVMSLSTSRLPPIFHIPRSRAVSFSFSLKCFYSISVRIKSSFAEFFVLVICCVQWGHGTTQKKHGRTTTFVAFVCSLSEFSFPRHGHVPVSYFIFTCCYISHCSRMVPTTLSRVRTAPTHWRLAWMSPTLEELKLVVASNSDVHDASTPQDSPKEAPVILFYSSAHKIYLSSPLCVR